MKHFILIFLLMGTLYGQLSIPHNGLWTQTQKTYDFYTEVYFHAELGIWILEHTKYLVGMDDKPTDIIVSSKYMSGLYYRLKDDLNSIIICKVDKFLTNGIKVNLPDSVQKKLIYSFRLTSNTTGLFGRVTEFNIHELYNLRKK